RRHDCDLRILSSQVSRRHCLLSIHDGVLSVEDLDSVNGTLVNGNRVTDKQELKPGDVLEIGPLRFTVQYEPTDEARSLKGQKAADSDEALEVLPLAHQKGKPATTFAFGDDDEELDALPVVEEDTEMLQAKNQGDEEEDAIPLADDLEEAGDWNLPQTGDLRSLLSEMDDSEGKPKRKGKH